MDWNVKYELGEAGRFMKKVTYATASKEFAEVGDRKSSDLECIRGSAKANLNLALNILNNKPATAMGRYSMSVQRQMDPTSRDFRKSQEKDRIVAKKSFFLNPHRNDPKVIKTKNRLYVI